MWLGSKFIFSIVRAQLGIALILQTSRLHVTFLSGTSTHPFPVQYTCSKLNWCLVTTSVQKWREQGEGPRGLVPPINKTKTNQSKSENRSFDNIRFHISIERKEDRRSSRIKHLVKVYKLRGTVT